MNHAKHAECLLLRAACTTSCPAPNTEATACRCGWPLGDHCRECQQCLCPLTGRPNSTERCSYIRPRGALYPFRR